MAIKWTGLGPGILLRLDRQLQEPLGLQLQSELRTAIRSGRLSAGERLPSSRTLARELGISRGLALECYEQLQAEGYLVTRLGSATRVALSAKPLHEPSAPTAREPRLAVDFRPGVPDLTSFPRRDWLWATGEATREARPADFGYSEPRGSLALRQTLSAYLRRVRGAVAEADNLVICSGFAQGLNLVLRALASLGIRKVGVEDPGDVDNRLIAVRAGLQAVPVQVDEHGVDVDMLASTGARAVILTPAHQSPTGVVLAPERRHALLKWANDCDSFIVEDDYDAEFRYDRQPIGQIQGLRPERVFGLSSVSKTLAPALRIGWIVCPQHLTETIAKDKHLYDRGSPGIDQLALARLIECGRYDKHLRHMRTLYEGRRRALMDSLSRHAPQVELRGLAAGFHAVAHLPKKLAEKAVVSAALSRSIGLYGMNGYRSSGATQPPQLVFGFGHLSESSIERGITAIAHLLSPVAD
jgi:GntR family transcriptional regulator/MocR family aminotransferase